MNIVLSNKRAATEFKVFETRSKPFNDLRWKKTNPRNIIKLAIRNDQTSPDADVEVKTSSFPKLTKWAEENIAFRRNMKFKRAQTAAKLSKQRQSADLAI